MDWEFLKFNLLNLAGCFHGPSFLLIFEKEKEKERREKKKEEEKKDLLIDTLFCFMDLIIIIFVRKGTYAFENKLRMKTK